MLQSAFYSSIEGLIDNSYAYYKSSVTGYSHFTEEGRDAVLEIVSMFAEKIIRVREKEFEQLIKDRVWSELNKE